MYHVGLIDILHALSGPLQVLTLNVDHTTADPWLYNN